MAQKSALQDPPSAVTVHAKSRVLELQWPDGTVHRLPFEFLRINSPSAEVRGHGPGPGILQTGKRDVEITALTPVGNYAVQPTFSDGHETGIFSWEYLYYLGVHQDQLMEEYEARLKAEGVERDAPMRGRLGAVPH